VQLLLQKEREDIRAVYKSAQPQQSKQNDVSTSTTEQLASRESSPPALQSLASCTYPVATECEFIHERSSPHFTGSLERMSAASSSVDVAVLSSCEVSDSGHHHFRSTGDVTQVLHKSLDSSFHAASKSQDLLPHYITQHSFPNAVGSCVRSVSASSAVGNTVQTLSDSVNVPNQLELKAAFAHGGMSDEVAHDYSNISGIK